MKNPFEGIFGGKTPPEKPKYTGEKKFTTDETGAVVTEETAKQDKAFSEERG